MRDVGTCEKRCTIRWFCSWAVAIQTVDTISKASAATPIRGSQDVCLHGRVNHNSSTVLNTDSIPWNPT